MCEAHRIFLAASMALALFGSSFANGAERRLPFFQWDKVLGEKDGGSKYFRGPGPNQRFEINRVSCQHSVPEGQPYAPVIATDLVVRNSSESTLGVYRFFSDTPSFSYNPVINQSVLIHVPANARFFMINRHMYQGDYDVVVYPVSDCTVSGYRIVFR